MIQDNEIKVAEDKEEAFWIKFKNDRLESIKASQRNIIVEQELVKLADRMLER